MKEKSSCVNGISDNLHFNDINRLRWFREFSYCTCVDNSRFTPTRFLKSSLWRAK